MGNDKNFSDFGNTSDLIGTRAGKKLKSVPPMLAIMEPEEFILYPLTTEEDGIYREGFLIG
jgi:hypothetical protein